MKHLIGHTPMISVHHPKARILAKLEWFNPAGSSKDRIARAMLDAAHLSPGSTVVEATSGNTGIALAALSAEEGYRCIIVMPENMSRERMALIRFYGAQVVLTPASKGMAAAMELARYLAADSGGFFVNQFENPANAQAHYETTGPEIWAGCGQQADIFVAGLGTGGTLTGTGRFLKEQQPHIRIVAVEPEAGHTIPGIGAGFTPPILDTSLLDERIYITIQDAMNAAKRSHLGCGISSGAVLHAAFLLANRPENLNKTIAALLPDGISRYLSELTT